MHARQSFHFQKITGSFKINIFFVAETFLYFQEKSPRIKLKVVKYLCCIFQKWAKRFLIFKKVKKKIFCFTFSIVFAFKQAKEHILFQLKTQKILNKKIGSF